MASSAARMVGQRCYITSVGQQPLIPTRLLPLGFMFMLGGCDYGVANGKTSRLTFRDFVFLAVDMKKARKLRPCLCCRGCFAVSITPPPLGCLTYHGVETLLRVIEAQRRRPNERSSNHLLQYAPGLSRYLSATYLILRSRIRDTYIGGAGGKKVAGSS